MRAGPARQVQLDPGRAGAGGTAAFEAAAKPVYERLAADPVAAKAIDAIRELKSSVQRSPGPLACGPYSQPAAHGFPVPDTTGFSAALPPAGTYRVTASAEELIEAGASPAYAAQNAGTWTWALSGDTWRQTGETSHRIDRCSGTLASDGDRVTFVTVGAGTCVLDYSSVWRADGDLFEYRVVAVQDPGSWRLQDWQNEQAWLAFPMQRID